VLLLPGLLLLFNGVLGIYTRLKTVSGTQKAAVLALSVICASTTVAFVSRDFAQVLLWGLLVSPPIVLARVLLNLRYSRHKRLATMATNQRGPVLVIGGAGYIGSHAVDLLLQSGRRVRVLDRLMYGRDSLKDFLDNPMFELIEGDVTDINRLTLATNGASAVIHLAGLVGDPACAVDERFTRHTNLIATRMAAEVAQSLGVRRFIFASSCSVYGVTDKEARELDELHPVSLYAQTKIDSERELLTLGRDDFFVTVLRFATVFGHSRRPRFDLVGNLFAAQAVKDGLITVIGPQQWRPFIHVRDLARALVIVLQANEWAVQDQIFNVGDKRLNMTILQLAEAVQKVAGTHRQVEISVSDDVKDRRNYAVSFEKIQSLLGFEAETLMEAGISEMVENLLAGGYQHYRDPIYSNAAMTKQAVQKFQDPLEMGHLYGPLRS
jgi:nucleoside-diphosphate-sugar epimerase